MFSMMPGPSSTLMGAPVVSTTAPGPRPEVSSYTWMDAASPFMFRISPIRRCSPTRTTSAMLATLPWESEKKYQLQGITF